MKKYINFIIITILTLILAGCSNNKKEEINIGEKAQEIMDNAKSIDINQKIEYKLIINDKEENTTEELCVYADLNEITFNESQTKIINKTSGTRHMNVLGIEFDEEILSYEQITENETIIHTYSKEKDIWKTEIDNFTNISNKNKFKINELLDHLILSKENIVQNNISCYEYYNTLNYSDLNLIFETNELEINLDDNLKDMKINIWVYINKETYEPVQIILDLSNNDVNMIVEEFRNLENMEYILDTYKITFNYNDFNTVESLIIPEEAFNTFNDDDLIIKDLKNN